MAPDTGHLHVKKTPGSMRAGTGRTRLRTPLLVKTKKRHEGGLAGDSDEPPESRGSPDALSSPEYWTRRCMHNCRNTGVLRRQTLKFYFTLNGLHTPCARYPHWEQHSLRQCKPQHSGGAARGDKGQTRDNLNTAARAERP
eukprot:1750839-Rhodomonas_salina.2